MAPLAPACCNGPLITSSFASWSHLTDPSVYLKLQFKHCKLPAEPANNYCHFSISFLGDREKWHARLGPTGKATEGINTLGTLTLWPCCWAARASPVSTGTDLSQKIHNNFIASESPVSKFLWTSSSPCRRWQFSSLTDNDPEIGVRWGGCWQTPQHSWRVKKYQFGCHGPCQEMLQAPDDLWAY